MAHLVGDIVDRCLNTWLLGTFRTQMNQLADAITDGTSTTVTCALPLSSVAKGSFVAIDDELMYVDDRDAATSTLTVVRGVRGTVPAQHVAASVVEINPRFPRFLVRQVMAGELDSWPGSLYRVAPVTVSNAANGGLLDVGAAVETAYGTVATKGVLKVRRHSLDITDARVRRTDGYEIDFDLVSTGGLFLNLARTIDVVTTFEVLVALDFDSALLEDDTTDLETDVGLAKGMCEILELGAAYRLLMGRGAVRLFPESEGQSRNAAEVGGHDIPALANQLMMLRERAIARESNLLYGRHGFAGRS